MPHTPQRHITACAFDLGNTLIHDTLVTREATEKIGRLAFPARIDRLSRSFYHNLLNDELRHSQTIH